MLSHLVGASNRSDRAALQRMENQKENFEVYLSKLKDRFRLKIKKRDTIIQEQKKKLALLNSALLRAQTKISEISRQAPGQTFTKPVNSSKVDHLEAQLSQANFQIKELKSVNQGLSSTVPTLKAEVNTLERCLSPEEHSKSKSPRFDLQRKCILYVGGRKREVSRLHTLITSWNGTLMHHDGGLEKSISELARAVNKADAVVFPIDRVSHNAASTVKRLCRQSLKTFVPMRTTGVACLINALGDILGPISTNSAPAE